MTENKFVEISLFFDCSGRKKALLFSIKWSNMVLKVVDSGDEWGKVVDKFTTLWISASFEAGDCVRCLWENTTTQ